MEKVITAKDLAIREGSVTVANRIKTLSKRFGHTCKDEVAKTGAVKARINRGRWIADCECGGAEYVDPAEPLFFCMSCGNVKTKGRIRTVIFPDNRTEIEQEIMSRPVKYNGGKDEIEKQLRATPIDEPRSWVPEEEA